MDQLILHQNSHLLRARLISDHVIRITHATAVDNVFPDDPLWLKDIFIQPFTIMESHAWIVSIQKDTLHIQNNKFQKSIDFLVDSPDRRGKSRGRIKTEPDEGFFGWGEWFNAFRRTEGKIALRNKESPAFLQHRQTYSNIPAFYSERGYLFFLLNGFPSTWKLDPDKRTISVKLSNGNLDYMIFTGSDPKEILSQYAGLTGKPPLLPKWAFGLWLTEYPQEDKEKTLAIVDEHEKRNIPLDALILDYHWEEKFHNFRWRKSLFPNSGQFIDQIHQKGIRLGLIFTPFVNKRHGIFIKLLLWLYARSVPPETFRENESDPVSYKEGKSNQYFANDQASWWFGKGGMIDFTNPKAANWFTNKLDPLYQEGIDFFKNDDGEYLPKNSHSSLGLQSEEHHNLYGFYYGKAVYESMQRLDDRRPIIYSRSVWAGSQRYPGMFLGDQAADFPNMQRAFWAGLNMSLLGFNYWTADCFGLSGKTSSEVHMRYAQWALLVPIARYFLRPAAIDPTRFPWSHGELAENNFRKYCELRYRLLPYYYSLAWNSYLTGIPMVHPLWFDFPGDKQSYKVQDQAMIGSNMMIAPIFRENARKRMVYFPDGKWFDYWTDKEIAGPCKSEIDAPIDRMPIFIKDGAIIPLGQSMQRIPNPHSFDQLDIHIWGDQAGSVRVYDDDGLSLGYSRGEFLARDISTSKSENQLSIDVSSFGKYDALNGISCAYTFHIHKNANIGSIFVNDKPVQPDLVQESATSQIICLKATFADIIKITLR